MFAQQIIDSDAFLDMPLSSQALYFHLSMRADDEGFINNPRKIQRTIGASDDDLKLLIAKSFIIPFESGIVVIKHWKIHNYIRADRIHETKYTEEKSLLQVKENGAYTLSSTICQPNDSQASVKCQARLDKNSIDKNSIDKNNKTPRRKIIPPELDWIKEYCKERNNNVDPEKFFDFYESKGWKVGKEKMKDWEASVRTWEKDDNRKHEPKKNDFKNFTQSNYDWDEINKELGIK